MAARVRARTAHMRDVLAWRDVRLVLSLFCLAQLLDGVTTYVALSTHQFQEANPLLGNILDSYPGAALAVKLGVAAIVVVAILAVRLRWRMRLIVTAIFAALSIIAPVANIVHLASAP